MLSSKIKRISSYILRNYCSWIPDRIYLRILFKVETGMSLNLKNPITFQEKIQWLKLYNRRSVYTIMVDKIAVKDFVKDKIGNKYIIPTIGVWDSVEQIDLSQLPDKFVLKTTNGGGSCGVVICKNKANFSLCKATTLMDGAKGSDVYRGFREWPYKNVPKRIIAEAYIEDSTNEDLIDYKFYCFDGEPIYCQVIRDRNSVETIDFYDTNWIPQPFVGLNPKALKSQIRLVKPQNFDIMIDICRKLSKDIPFVRIDQYNVNGTIYFGEITFYPGSGLGRFEPREWNNKLGNLIHLENLKYEKN